MPPGLTPPATAIYVLVAVCAVRASVGIAAPSQSETPDFRRDPPRIAVIDPVNCVDDTGVSDLHTLGSVALHDHVRTEAQTTHGLAGADIAIVDSFSAPLTAAVLERADTLKLLVICSTGYDLVDLAAANRKGIRVANVPAYSTEAVAEQTVALIFAVGRHLLAADAGVRRGQFETDGTNRVLLGSDLSGKTLGIIGLGKIGARVAQLGQGIGMRVVAWDRSTKPVPGVIPVTLEQLLEESDVVSLHLPLTPETKGILNAERLHLMKPAAILINTARGGLIDEAALYETLRSRKIAGAGLDVVSRMSTSNPLLTLRNVVFSPHSGYYTRESLRLRAQTIVETVADYLGGRPINIINSK
jgi:phosphoglycerate dehydrogenase-like enzyme